MERYQKHLDNSLNRVSFDTTSPWQEWTLQQPYNRRALLEISSSHRNGFSKSLGDLSSLSSPGRYQRRTVMFEEDLKTHAEMLDRARTRFRELELKYPEVFKNSSRTSSISSLNTLRGHSMAKQPSIELSYHRCESENQNYDHDLEVKEIDQLGDLTQVPAYRKHSGGQRRRAPLLSSSMRSHNLEDSCDSAFDEIDRESNDQSPNYVNNTATSSTRFLYPGDSLESDKDSGISTDQPFVPPTKTLNFQKRATFLESETGQINKSLSLSQPSLLSDSSSHPNWQSTDQPTRNRTSRQGILKSTAYRNQGIRSESLDAEFPLDRVKYTTRRSRLQALKTGSEVYRRSTTHIPSFLSQDNDCSDSETAYEVNSVRSEVLIRPKISARQQYLSTYGLDRINSDEKDTNNNRLVKSKSLPNLGYSQSSFDEATGFSGAVLSCDNPKKRKKRILQRFGRRSGLYVVNDIPASEKPKLPLSPGNSWKKRRSKFKKSASLEPSHVNETTKVWYDHTTAVSRPSNGQVLGRVLTLREDLGMAYEIELQRPNDGLFGFFIQKGYKECRKGVFISRIMDSSSSKFIAGLLNPGDELLEVNGQSTQTKSVAQVQNIMAHSDKLLLTVLPYVSRKDW